MTDEESQKQIDDFLAELKQLVKDGKATGDLSGLYAKYPKVKIGIRRAMFFVDKKIREEQRQAFFHAECKFNRVHDNLLLFLIWFIALATISSFGYFVLSFWR